MDNKGNPSGLKNYSFIILANKKSYKIDTIRSVDKIWKNYDVNKTGYLTKKETQKLM